MIRPRSAIGSLSASGLAAAAQKAAAKMQSSQCAPATEYDSLEDELAALESGGDAPATDAGAAAALLLAKPEEAPLEQEEAEAEAGEEEDDGAVAEDDEPAEAAPTGSGQHLLAAVEQAQLQVNGADEADPESKGPEDDANDEGQPRQLPKALEPKASSPPASAAAATTVAVKKKRGLAPLLPSAASKGPSSGGAIAEPATASEAAVAAPADPKPKAPLAPALTKKRPAVSLLPASTSAVAASTSAAQPKSKFARVTLAGNEEEEDGEAAGEGAAAAGPKKPKIETAFTLYCKDKKADVKKELPKEASGTKEVNARLKELWGELSPEDKAPYEEEAEKDKASKAEAMAAWKAASKAAVPSSAAAAAGAKPKKEKASKVTSKSMMKEPEEEEAPGQAEEQATEDKVDSPVAAADDEEGKAAAAPPAAAVAKKPSKKAAKGSSKGSSSSKSHKRKRAAAAEEEEEGDGSGKKKAEDSDEEDDWEWDGSKGKAEAILCRSLDSRQFVVGRFDESLAEAGLVDAMAAKRQRTTGEDPACPVSLKMVEEHEEFERSFKAEVRERNDNGALDLEAIPPGSNLEICYFLWRLRQPGQLLSKVDRSWKQATGVEDRMVHFPAMALSLVVQKLVNDARAEGKRAAEAAATGSKK